MLARVTLAAIPCHAMSCNAVVGGIPRLGSKTLVPRLVERQQKDDGYFSGEGSDERKGQDTREEGWNVNVGLGRNISFETLETDVVNRDCLHTARGGHVSRFRAHGMKKGSEATSRSDLSMPCHAMSEPTRERTAVCPVVWA